MIGQTIAIVDKSGKVMKSGNHLMSVFKEAKSAYQERKAEIVAARQMQVADKPKPRRAYTVQDDMSVASSRRSRRDLGGERRHHSHKRRHSGGHTKPRSVYAEDVAAQQPGFRNPFPTSPRSPASPASPASPRTPGTPTGGISRSHTMKAPALRDSYFPPVPVRAMSTGNIDMDLAYGEPPPNLFSAEVEEEAELKGLVGRVRGLLDEANCLQYSATQTIQQLQKNPDAMAAVALSLAEISNLVKKMSPGVLLKLKTVAPSVFALLASPQFMIASGMAVGVTIIAFGGYKIVKKIQEKKVAESQMEDMIDITSEVSRIDQWRQGIAQVEAESVGTSVDGEFITPTALSMSRLNLHDKRTGEKSDKSKPRSPKTAKSTKTTKTAKSTTSKSSKTSKDRSSKEKSSRNLKEKKPSSSPLRLMFT